MAVIYQQARFLTSAPHLRAAPADSGREVAFAGRSNAGKSSVINALTGQSRLARVSKTPGRTQLLNFFQLDGARRLVDLPGYGYAQVPETIKQQWRKMMEEYFRHRAALCGLVLVMDVRHPLTDYDWQMIEWCRHHPLALHVLLTKVDKLKYGAAKNTLLQVGRELRQVFPTAGVQLFSAPHKTGVEELVSVLDAWLSVGSKMRDEL